MPGGQYSDDEESYYSDEERAHVPREMVTSGKHFTCLELDGTETLDRFLSCPVCLSLLRQPTATECLHRFCADCINTALRFGKKECPACRFPIATKRALRRDDNFEALINTLYPNGAPESDDEVVDLGSYKFVPLRPAALPPTAQPPPAPPKSSEAAGASSGGSTVREPKGRSPKAARGGGDAASHDGGAGSSTEASAPAAKKARSRKAVQPVARDVGGGAGSSSAAAPPPLRRRGRPSGRALSVRC